MRWLLLVSLLLYHLTPRAQMTYYQDIAPILSEHCTSCHRDGDIGPMPLTTYAEVASYASMIKFVTDTELMPPFIADVNRVSYKNHRSISEADRAIIAQWITDGLPPGDSVVYHELPLVSTIDFDTTICMSESFQHYGIYYDQYQVFPLPTQLSKGRIIKNIVFEPGNREIVRSAQISVAPNGSSTKMDAWDPRYGYYAYGSLGFITSHPAWYSWVPHANGLELSEHERLYLPPDSELLMHIHYGPYGQIQKDSSCIHLSYDDQPIATTSLQNVPLVHTEFLNDTFLLEANKQHRIRSTFTLPIDAQLRSITPLAHLLCRSWEVFAVLPDKTSKHLLVIEDWDFHWREKYVFDQPMNLPAGTKIYATAIYDNTVDNPYNPADPPTTMRKGPHMFDENFVCYFEFLSSTIQGSTIGKPFVTAEGGLKSLDFHVEKSGTYTLTLHAMDTMNSSVLATGNYPRGSHAIRSSNLPRSSGRYAITLSHNEEIVDSWWFVIY